jgi:hypothetical protein
LGNFYLAEREAFSRMKGSASESPKSHAAGCFGSLPLDQEESWEFSKV